MSTDGQVRWARELMKRHLKAFMFLIFLMLLSGFDFTTRSIPIEEIQGGGPPRDGIPALTDPVFVRAGGAFLPGFRAPGTRARIKPRGFLSCLSLTTYDKN